MNVEKMKRRARVLAGASALVEGLEPRKLFAAAPSFIAIGDGTANFGSTRRAVAYYDVSDVNGQPAANFANAPDFVIWSGYEATRGPGPQLTRNFEEISGIDVNRSNGDTYVLAFDSIPDGQQAGDKDGVGDTVGDYDLYRYNFARAYDTYLALGRKGVMLTDTTTVDSGPNAASGVFNYQTAYGARALGPTGLPAVSSSDTGVPAGRDNTDADPNNDFYWVTGLVDKVAEIGRAFANEATPFFDQQDIQYVDDGTILLMENRSEFATSADLDYSIRTIERASTLPNTGLTVPTASNGFAGGYSGSAVESWNAHVWQGDNFVNMDDFATGGLSEVDGMRYVERDGNRGVWVSDRDSVTSAMSFFSLDFASRTATKTVFAGGTAAAFSLEEDPTQDNNDGDIDNFNVDENGRLVIVEGSFNDTPKGEPKIQTFTVDNYAAGSNSTIDLGTYATRGTINPTVDDDPDTTNGSYSVYVRGQNRVYIFDTDSGAEPGVRADVYAYDLTTGQLVHQELNGVNMFFADGNKIRSFTLGDYATVGGSLTSQDGIIDAADIDALYARIADPTFGGRFTAALGTAMFDLDGDGGLSVGDPYAHGSVNGDIDYLVRRVAATEYGDTDFDYDVDGDDGLNVTFGNLFGGSGWAQGDIDGDGDVDGDDALATEFAFLFNPNPVRV